MSEWRPAWDCLDLASMPGPSMASHLNVRSGKTRFIVCAARISSLKPSWYSPSLQVDASSLTNSHMSEADVERALAQAVSWIENADAILLGSGAGFGVDSGLATFRNSKVGVWRGMEKVLWVCASSETCLTSWAWVGTHWNAFSRHPNFKRHGAAVLQDVCVHCLVLLKNGGGT